MRSSESQENLKLVPGSPQQEAIWAFLLNDLGHGLVDARAGSGKTFTLVQAVLRLLRTLCIGVFSFNRHIVQELDCQLRRLGILRAQVMTYHSFGFRAVRNAIPRVQLMEEKLWTIARQYTSDKDALPGLVKLVRLCKNYLIDGTDPDRLAELVVRHNVEVEEEYAEDIFALVPRVLRDCLNHKAAVDFDDQIWWPVILKLPVQTFDLVLVDEAQDTNKTQQALLRMACPEGRIIVVGDRHQSVYGFRGADIDAIPSLYDTLKDTKRECSVLPLTVTRRCPKSHVRLAQSIIPDIEAMDDAPEGEVLVVGMKKAVEMMRPGDMVICRVNRCLMPVALRLISRGIYVVVRGREVGKGLITLIDNLKARNLVELMSRLFDYQTKEAAKWLALGDRGAARLEELEDRIGCLLALSEGVSEIAELREKIERIFADFDDDGRPRDAVLLGTIHRTKGLEANNVFVLAPELLPHPAAKQAWEREQERNLAYIAATRAKFELGRHPGRLVFVGSIPDIYRH